MSCTGGTGTTILHMRSCTEGATPDMGCLSEGELALNITDGKIFTRGCTTGQLFTWSSDGSTADDIVTSVQGMTGDVTFADLVGVCSVNGFTGAVDFTTKTFHAAGFSTQGGITAEGNSHKLGLVFESFHSGVTIASTNNRHRILLGNAAEPHDFMVSLSNNHREVLQANSDGITIGVPVGISGGLCGDHGEFRGLSTDGIDVVGGKIRVGTESLGQYTSYSFPTSYSQAASGQPKVLLQKNTLTGLGSDHPTVFEPLRDHCVESVNGSTGTVTNIATTNTTNIFAEQQAFAKGISINAGGITFADGTHQTTAFRAGLKYTVTHTGVAENPSAGGIKMASNVSGTAIDVLSIHDTDANGNDISSIMTLFADNGGFVQVLKEDGTELLIAAVDANETSIATFGSDILQITAASGIEVDTAPSVNDVVYVYIIPNLVNAVQTIAGQQGNIQVQRGLTMEIIASVGYLGVLPEAMSFESPTSGGRVIGITFNDNSRQTTAATADVNTATFSIDASSGIATGAKTKALHRVPFDATLTKFELKSSAVGFTGAVYVAGSDFGLPTTGAVTGCSLGVSGLTGSTTVFNNATITAGNFLYFEVFNNTNGATNAQAFLTYTRR